MLQRTDISHQVTRIKERKPSNWRWWLLSQLASPSVYDWRVLPNNLPNVLGWCFKALIGDFPWQTVFLEKQPNNINTHISKMIHFWFYLYDYLVGGLVSTHLKKHESNLDHFPNFCAENKTYLSCHHLVYHDSSEDILMINLRLPCSGRSISDDHFQKKMKPPSHLIPNTQRGFIHP